MAITATWTGRQSRPVPRVMYVQTCPGIPDPWDLGSWVTGSWSWILGSQDPGSWVRDPRILGSGSWGHGILGHGSWDPGRTGRRPVLRSLDPSAIQTPLPTWPAGPVDRLAQLVGTRDGAATRPPRPSGRGGYREPEPHEPPAGTLCPPCRWYRAGAVHRTAGAVRCTQGTGRVRTRCVGGGAIGPSPPLPSRCRRHQPGGAWLSPPPTRLPSSSPAGYPGCLLLLPPVPGKARHTREQWNGTMSRNGPQATLVTHGDPRVAGIPRAGGRQVRQRSSSPRPCCSQGRGSSSRCLPG